jgi:hypothetical protein
VIVALSAGALLSMGHASAAELEAEWCGYGAPWGGTFYCNSNYEHQLPDGRFQVFVIGTDREAWTRWDTGNGLSNWASLGGQCIEPGNDSIDLAWIGSSTAWNFAIQCKGTNHLVYYNQRSADGTWTGWYRPGT